VEHGNSKHLVGSKRTQHTSSQSIVTVQTFIQLAFFRDVVFSLDKDTLLWY